MTDREASSRLNVISTRLTKIVTNKLHKNKLPKEDNEYFTLSLANNNKIRTPQFYDMAKVHKNETPVPLHPVASKWLTWSYFCITRPQAATTY